MNTPDLGKKISHFNYVEFVFTIPPAATVVPTKSDSDVILC